MNIFQSDKAPYILALLLTILGWHVTQIVNEVTKSQSVTFRLDIDRETGEVVALIHNVSRTKSLVNATFSLACPDGSECLEPIRPPRTGEDPVYGEVRSIPPNAIAAERRGNSSSSVAMANTVAAGGRYQIIARLKQPSSGLEFFFVPDEERPLDILIYDGKSILGLLVSYYFELLLISFLLLLLILLVSLAWNRPAVLKLRAFVSAFKKAIVSKLKAIVSYRRKAIVLRRGKLDKARREEVRNGD